LIDETLGKYKVVEHLGQGAMAEVYKAYQPSLDRHVAIKVLHSFLANEKDFLSRALRGARAVATLRHPNIVQVYDFDYDKDQDIYFLVMEYVDGLSLKDRLEALAEQDSYLPWDEVVRIMTAVGEALAYAHERGMVHRDVKPANIMFNEDGEVILTDFGIAKMVGSQDLTASGAMVGTPAYIAPEVAEGRQVDGQSDIYSLGVVLYQVLTGSLPFEADTPIGVALKHIQEPLPSAREVRPDLPAAIEPVLERAMAKDPDDRYQTAIDFVADLRQAMASVGQGAALTDGALDAKVSEEDQSADDSSADADSSVSLRRRWWRLAALGAGVLLLLGAIGVLASRNQVRLLANLASSEATITPSSTSLSAAALEQTQESMSRTSTPEPTPSSTPTATPPPDLTATAWAACDFDFDLESNRGVWPSVLIPRQEFSKYWRIRNTGTCTLPQNLEWTFVSGEKVEVVAEPMLEPLAVDDVLDLEARLRAPEKFGTYTTAWQLQGREGDPVGQPLEAFYEVGPTQTPTPLVPTPVGGGGDSLWMTKPRLVACDGVGGRVAWSAGGGPSDNYRYFYSEATPGFELSGPVHNVENLPAPVTYLTASGDLTFPVPGRCGEDDEGRCTGPDGEYEIVWRKVWLSSDLCP
jgi:serine/threonine protein kinase